MKIVLHETEKREVNVGDVVIAKIGANEKSYLQIVKFAGTEIYKLVDLTSSIAWGVEKTCPFELLKFLQVNHYKIVEIIPFEKLILTCKTNV